MTYELAFYIAAAVAVVLGVGWPLLHWHSVRWRDRQAEGRIGHIRAEAEHNMAEVDRSARTVRDFVNKRLELLSVAAHDLAAVSSELGERFMAVAKTKWKNAPKADKALLSRLDAAIRAVGAQVNDRVNAKKEAPDVVEK